MDAQLPLSSASERTATRRSAIRGAASNRLIRFVLKPAVFLLCLMPLIWLGWLAATGGLGVNPIETVNRSLGDWAHRFLLISLAVSPAKEIFGWPLLMRFRRMLGLFAFFYVAVHLSSWIGLDQFFAWRHIWADTVKRPFITLGMLAFLTLLPLAATSTDGMVKRLGAKRWKQLHMLVYPAAALAVFHYFMMVKADVREPLIYAAVLAVLLGWRALARWPRRRPTGACPPSASRDEYGERDNRSGGAAVSAWGRVGDRPRGEPERRSVRPRPSMIPGRPGGARLKSGRKRTASSRRWLQRQLKDPYVAEAKRRGFRSRAAFKLIELDDRFRLLRPGARIVDLGAAPGGWTQVAVERVRAGKPGGGRVLAVDLLEMSPVAGAEVLRADVLDETTPALIRDALAGPADVVLSDMALPSTGHPGADHLRIMALLEAAFGFAGEVLAPGGAFVCKVRQGGTEAHVLAAMKRLFRTVRHAKPPSSRAESAEFYVVATGFHGR